MKPLSFFIIVLLFIPGLHALGQVKIGDGTPAHPSSILEVKSTDGGMLVPRMTKAQRDSIPGPAEGLILYQTNGASGFWWYNGTAWTRIGEHSGHYVGEPFAGGIIFYLDETGKHGLIVSADDLSDAWMWSNVSNVLIGPTAQSVWNGPGNSLAVVGQPQHVSSAAKLCLDWTNQNIGTGVFTDWYLPSTGETRHLVNNIYQVQKTLETDGDPLTTPISDGFYWTSNEASDTTAWGCGMADPQTGPFVGVIKSEPLFVRAVRAF